MKAIINNKIYDTDKCKSLFTYYRRILKKGLFGDYYVWYEAEILKTAKGTYLRYTDKPLETGYRDINELVILTEEEVKSILVGLKQVEVYEKEFGKLEEG